MCDYVESFLKFETHHRGTFLKSGDFRWNDPISILISSVYGINTDLEVIGFKVTNTEAYSIFNSSYDRIKCHPLK